MRGEKCYRIGSTLSGIGSSPHARGKVTVRIFDSICDRIIPACAGKSGCHIKAIGYDRDHPRMRGEKNGTQSVHEKHKGSSPHARGKATDTIHQSISHRIIPACAGKRQIACGRVLTG